VAGRAAAIFGLLVLGACAQLGLEPLPPTDYDVAPGELEFDASVEAYQRTFERSLTETPFEFGSMSVVATEDGQLSTYNFFPCHGGRGVCSGSPQGPAGRLFRSPQHYVLTGLHGRTFWLGYGGDGYVQRGDSYVSLAWNARRLGTGDGSAGSVETPYPH
jgi:hypothetical protein